MRWAPEMIAEEEEGGGSPDIVNSEEERRAGSGTDFVDVFCGAVRAGRTVAELRLRGAILGRFEITHDAVFSEYVKDLHFAHVTRSEVDANSRCAFETLMRRG